MTLKRPKGKGTGFETWVVNRFNAAFGGSTVGGIFMKRTPASTVYDLEAIRPTNPEVRPLNLLITRPDRGRALVTLDLDDFIVLYGSVLSESDDGPLHVECKRLARIALHKIFEEKFGR